ncbi:hypothetical protein TSOC_006383 [Tetrabaena socialis]|uniref:Uncharacterized protein n=1 Tax=Tetrabaena socialis TaxID=47790 RepID=A0A2J8A3R5_9CHLO|nr:hypothetical protein TSOC_006383 [Tetrabaena socialis]|eukprot:PNH07169.1 hypothetical protein TSOC_006383 [Tetrabaena socialis]
MQRRQQDKPTAAGTGIKLSWLVTGFHASLQTLETNPSVGAVVAGMVLPAGPFLPPDSRGPATLLVLVHPTCPWLLFMRALLAHVHTDLKRALLAGGASPASPAAGASQGGWRAQGAEPEPSYHSTYLHLEFLTSDLHASGGAWALHADRGTAPQSVPVLLVLDPAGAVFTDPRALRAVQHAAALATPPHTGRSRDQPDPTATAPSRELERPPPRPPLQLASCLAPADWPRLVAAVSRLLAAPDADAAVDAGGEDVARRGAVLDAVLEAARLQHAAFAPLLATLSGAGDCPLGADGCVRPPAAREAQPSASTLPVLPLLPGQARAQALGPGPDAGPASRSTGPESMCAMPRVSRAAAAGPVAAAPAAASPQHARAPSSPALPAAADAGPAACAERSDAAGGGGVLMTRRSRSMSSALDAEQAAARERLLAARLAASYEAAEAEAAAAAAARRPSEGALALGGLGAGPGARALSGSTCRISASSLQLPYAGVRGPAPGPARIPALGGGPAASSLPLGGGSGSPVSLVPYAFEAARRYAALLEGVGLWAAAGAALEACVGGVSERWGQRSAQMAALRSQLGRLQQLQGLHKAAEVSWRQALEALERCSGPDSPPALLATVALAGVLACLKRPVGQDPEQLLRSSLSALDAQLGPAAAETLEARRALAAHVAAGGRWAEAEVLYQSLLLSVEEAEAQQAQREQDRPPYPQQQQPAAAQGSLSDRQQLLPRLPVPPAPAAGAHRAPSRLSSRQLLAAAALQAGGESAAAPGLWRSDSGTGALGGGGDAGSGASARRVGRSDSRARVAWARDLEVTAEGPAANTGAPSGVRPPYGQAGASAGGGDEVRRAPARHPSIRLPPVAGLPQLKPASPMSPQTPAAAAAPPSAAAPTSPHPGGTSPISPHSPLTALIAPPAPLLSSPSAATIALRRSGQPPGPDAAAASLASAAAAASHALTWSGDSAALADVVAAVFREYDDGANPQYDGMHLAGPEGSIGGDLAAMAAVCPRSGACLTAVVYVRRLTDSRALYGRALAAREAGLGRRHPATAELRARYGRHLSAAGEHAEAEAACREALAALAEARVPGEGGGGGRGGGGGGGGAGGRGRLHPAEVGVRCALGAVLAASGPRGLTAALAAWSEAVAAAGALVAAGEMAAADARRLEAIDGLAEALAAEALAQLEAAGGAAAAGTPAAEALARAVDAKRQALDLAGAVCGWQHERALRGWLALGRLHEAGGELGAAEAAYGSACEVALYRHGRLTAATKAVVRNLHRVYLAAGRTADAEVLGHMYRLSGGLLARKA